MYPLQISKYATVLLYCSTQCFVTASRFFNVYDVKHYSANVCWTSCSNFCWPKMPEFSWRLSDKYFPKLGEDHVPLHFVTYAYAVKNISLDVLSMGKRDPKPVVTFTLNFHSHAAGRWPVFTVQTTCIRARSGKNKYRYGPFPPFHLFFFLSAPFLSISLPTFLCHSVPLEVGP